ncbi:MAG TPA: GntR family transcriptional regulator [Anaerolineae bacterium]|nr:GntR family transcriptional regulator [Anaerolineae bacterium]HPL30198.1 GntR family transcriptional regulator [Anaerolineae bacterium]
MGRKRTTLAQQVMQELLAGIEAGDLAREGGLLPSEAQLGQRYGVSRATLREALAQLELRGVITRRQGVGTFVAPPPPLIETGLEVLESLEAMAQRIGLETRMLDAVTQEREATRAEADLLQVPPGTPILAVDRVMVADGSPVAYLVDVVPIAFLRREDLDGSFSGSVLDLFLRRGEPALSHSRADIMAERATSPIARKLSLRRGATLLKLQAQLVARDGRIVDYSLSYFVTGCFRFHVIRRIGPASQFEPVA